MARFSKFGTLLLFIIFAAGLSFAQAPAIFFTDLDSGPNSGGESVSGFAGAYVTIYGDNFGASQGSSTVTLGGSSCLRVVSWGTPYLWYQKVVVQLGSSCASGNFVVTTSAGTSNGLAFTVRSGNIYCISTGGSDTASGKFGSCWASIYHAVATMVAGDTVYMENGYSASGNDGSVHSNHCVEAVYTDGANGANKAFVAYPGATVTFTGNGPSDPTFGFCEYANYITVAGLTLRATTSAGRIQSGPQGTGGTGNRMIANDIQCNNSGTCASGEDGCLATYQLVNSASTPEEHLLGNNIHDVCTVQQGVNTTGKYFHSIYIGDQSSNTEFGWNQILNNYANRGLQIYSSTQPEMYNLIIHDNYVYNSRGIGLLVGSNDPSLGGPVEVYNNVVVHAGVGPGFSTDGPANPYCATAGDSGSGSSTHPQQWYNNTFYDCGCDLTAFGGTCQNDGAVFQEGDGGNSFIFENNIAYAVNTVYMQANEGTATNSFQNTPTSVCSNNLWFGAGTAPTNCSNNVTSNPLLVSPSTGNAQVQSGSPAIGAGVNLAGLVPYDVDGLVRPNPPSIGAYELTGSTRPNPPTGVTVSVQ